MADARNRPGNLRIMQFILFVVLLVSLFPVVFSQSLSIPVYIEDSHAGHFFYLAQTLDLSASYHLINFDAHPDSVRLPEHRLVRSRLRDPSLRDTGIIQCYNWIHGLTPNPVSFLTWVYPATGPASPEYNVPALLAQMNSWFPAPAGRATSLSMRELDRLQPGGQRVVVSIDLDFFCESRDLAADVRRVFSFIRGLENLACITVAISRPYLPDDAFAFQILKLALEELLETPRVSAVQFEPFVRDPVDLSLRAAELQAQGLPVPYFDLGKAPESFREMLAENQDRLIVMQDREAWLDYLGKRGE